MDFEQLTHELSGLTRMAESSRVRLEKLAGRVTNLREQLKQMVTAATPDETQAISSDDPGKP